MPSIIQPWRIGQLNFILSWCFHWFVHPMCRKKLVITWRTENMHKSTKQQSAEWQKGDCDNGSSWQVGCISAEEVRNMIILPLELLLMTASFYTKSMCSSRHSAARPTSCWRRWASSCIWGSLSGWTKTEHLRFFLSWAHFQKRCSSDFQDNTLNLNCNRGGGIGGRISAQNAQNVKGGGRITQFERRLSSRKMQFERRRSSRKMQLERRRSSRKKRNWKGAESHAMRHLKGAEAPEMRNSRAPNRKNR